jgi:uncharacterized phiE125 gp8 family phage protein
MMLIEQGGVPQAALPVAELRAHLRLGTGFADDGFQDALLESHLRAAIAAIEGRTAKVLVARRFQWVIEDWRNGSEQALPVAPVTAVVSVTLVDAAGVPAVVASDRYRLVRDLHRPKLAAAGAVLPLVPEGGSAEIVFDAGFGADWASLPADLAQAVMLLAAEFYENRHEAGQCDAGGMPAAVQALTDRWRIVRTLAGGAG